MRSIVIQPQFLRSLGDCFVLKEIDDNMHVCINEQSARKYFWIVAIIAFIAKLLLRIVANMN